MNSWLGALQCEDVRWRVYTAGADFAVPFTGRVLTREAPGGYDYCCEQRVATLHSFRPIWQAVLDRELCEMALVAQRLRDYGPRCIKQLRVDGIVCQIPRKEQAGFPALNEEAWPCGLRKYKAEKLKRDSPTIITVGCFRPHCAPSAPPPGVGGST